MKPQRMEMSFGNGKWAGKISTEVSSQENILNRKWLNSELNKFDSKHPTLLSKWKITEVFFTDKVTYIHRTYLDISKSFNAINLILGKLKTCVFS